MMSLQGLTLSAVLIGLTFVCQVVTAQDTLLEDEFEFFELGETWQEHGAGAPDITLEVGFSDDSEVLQMISSGFEEAFFGVETITPLSLAGVGDLTVDARLRPINQGVEGAVAAAEVALIGESGEIIRAFASNNAGPDPESMNDWADHYEDSKGNIGTSGPWPHCDAACDAMRNFVISVNSSGTTLTAYDDLDDLDFPTWETTFDDFTLADLGSNVTIALRQLAVENGDNVAGFFDYIVVTSSGAVGLPGDYDANGVVDAEDANLQSVAMKDANPDLETYDEDGDGAVDYADRLIWVKSHAGTWVGDSDLNGEFNSGDFVAVFTAGLYETGEMAGWVEGDWDGNMVFDSGDFVKAFDDGGYEMGPAAVAAVPEPASACLLMLGACALVFRRRR